MKEKTARKVEIRGLVQGVGFRPFIYRLASEFKLLGTVENNNRGVTLYIEGDETNVSQFIDNLPKRIPEASSISFLEVHETKPERFIDFSIIKSKSISDEVTEVSPDIGVCKECLDDMNHQAHRINYPFTNCTNCGPRFTIIKDLPYDRHQTTMKVFEMCDICHSEYIDILDRRFHAQPVACNNCGPHYTLHLDGKKENNIDVILQKTARLLEEGKILTIKGLGGYHMACNPFQEKVVSALRLRKAREGKPFALMFKNVQKVKDYLHLSKEEEELLTSWRKPIVLLKSKRELAPSISIGLDSVGVMLPYMPFHYQLFEKLNLPAIVLTSGNISDEPILIDNESALQQLGKISEAVITYNRDIHNRTDDSVAFIANKKPRIIRRSRSYAPSPVEIDLDAEGIFAAGAELVNCFAIGKGNQVIMSQHIGDLKNLETLEFYSESVERYHRLFRFQPSLAVMDMHPDYLSSRFVQDMDIPSITVQHHHAHIASCMAEHKIDEKIIGISFDGTGLGSDGHIWGGEFMVADLLDFERITHFEYIPQPGGDAVTKHPWRMMLAYLHHYYGNEVVQQFPFIFEGIDQDEISLILSMLNNKLNTPLTSSTGRLFDAVSALLNICRDTTYHAEAPMRLESVATENIETFYNYELKDTIQLVKTFAGMIMDLKDGTPVGVISSKFHNTIVQIILETVKAINKKTGINKVAISGGSFQNRILLAKTEVKLTQLGYTVYSQSNIPSNDGGIALGQLAIAAKRRGMLKNEG